MSSPNPSTPRRSSRRSRGSTPGTPVGGAPSASGTDAGGGEPSSELARPLPQSSPQMPPPSDAAMAPNSVPQRDRSSVGPGSVLVSEIDLSSPLNYGTPSSVDSRARGSQQQLHGLGVGSNVIGTPIRVRSDIQSEKRLRQVNVTPGGVPYDPVSERGVSSEAGGTPRANRNPPSEVVPPSEHSDTAPHLVIWGTDVSVHTCKQKFRKFLTTFVDPDLADDERMEGFRADEPLYMQRLEEIEVLGVPYLNLNCSHINMYDEDLYRQLICYPQEVIPTLDMAVNELFFEKNPSATLSHQIQVRPFNADRTRNMRALNPEDIDQLITITGMVIRTSNLVPEMCEAFFRCSVCHFSATVEVERGRIAEPTLCTNCNTNHSFTLVHNRSQFSDKQTIKLQESPDDMPAGQTPHTVVLYAHGDLVDTVQPGDRIAVTGIYRAVPIRVNPLQRNIKSVYKTHIDVVHFRKTDSCRLHEATSSGETVTFTEEKIQQIQALAAKPDLYERLARAIAPSIYEHEDIKKGILLQLFGGSHKDLSATGRNNFRSEVNILLCGDPGTSKSQLLQYVYNLVPRSQYTSGKGSSAVGLTAYVTKDPETRQLVLQTGALVLADNGICCIDEFDKMSDSTRSILHEVMEQQTLSIAKAGIICQLNARTSILAAANPIESQWNIKKTIVENIQLPHTLMSRFDLIFLMLDPQDELFDKRLGRHLVSLYYKTALEAEEEELDMGVLRDYLAYAKQNFNPRLSDEAGNHLVQAYVKMRELGNRRGRVTAYPRQLESLIRLAEAHAKMRLSEKVEMVDVEEANRLHQEALKQSATDPMSGIINLDIITTGQSEGYRKRRDEVRTAFKALLQKKGKVHTLNYGKTWMELKEQSDVMITREMFEDALKDLSEDGLITLTGRATIRVNKH